MEVTGVGRQLSKTYHLCFVSSHDFLLLLLQKAGDLICDKISSKSEGICENPQTLLAQNST